MRRASASILNNPRLRSGALRFVLLATCWWILTEGAGGWEIGLPVAAGVSLVSLWLTPVATFRLNLLQLPSFIGFFLIQSLRSGWDVARRTLQPEMPLYPAIVRVPLNLPPGAPTWWLMITLNLLPGTLNVRLDRQQRELEIHCLDMRMDVHADVARTEAQLSRLFANCPTITGRDA